MAFKKNKTLLILALAASFVAGIVNGVPKNKEISIVEAETLPINYTGNYYNGYDTSKTGAELLQVLSTRINTGASVIGYSSLASVIYPDSDIRPGTNYIWDMYSNEKYTLSNPGGNSYEGAGWNKEHSVPQSWFSEASPMKSDAFHVYPTDCYVNNKRSNYPFGEVKSATWTSKNGSKLGSSGFTGYSGIVFEPIDEYKGDFARTYFYMATRYADKCGNWSKGAEVCFNSTSTHLTDYARNLFLKWSRQDPVSEKEINRNEGVYKHQKNRNPFIDNPNWIEAIWGNGGSSQIDDEDDNKTKVTPTETFTITPDNYETFNGVEFSGCEVKTYSGTKEIIQYKSGTISCTIKNITKLELEIWKNYNDHLVFPNSTGTGYALEGIETKGTTTSDAYLYTYTFTEPVDGFYISTSITNDSDKVGYYFIKVYLGEVDPITTPLQRITAYTTKAKLNVKYSVSNDVVTINETKITYLTEIKQSDISLIDVSVENEKYGYVVLTNFKGVLLDEYDSIEDMKNDFSTSDIQFYDLSISQSSVSEKLEKTIDYSTDKNTTYCVAFYCAATDGVFLSKSTNYSLVSLASKLQSNSRSYSVEQQYALNAIVGGK